MGRVENLCSDSRREQELWSTRLHNDLMLHAQLLSLLCRWIVPKGGQSENCSVGLVMDAVIWMENTGIFNPSHCHHRYHKRGKGLENWTEAS